MRDWADAARAQGGLAVAVHFPLPYAEIAADIVCGRDRCGRDAGADTRASTGRRSASGTASSLRIPAAGRRWHRQDVGRGPGRGDPDLRPARPGRAARRSTTWADAVRAGRTFVSSGRSSTSRSMATGQATSSRSVRGGGTVEVRVRRGRRSRVIDTIELIHDGQVVATSRWSHAHGSPASLSERVTIGASGWLAARVDEPRAHPFRASRRAWVPTARRSMSMSAGSGRSRSRTPQ